MPKIQLALAKNAVRIRTSASIIIQTPRGQNSTSHGHNCREQRGLHGNFIWQILFSNDPVNYSTDSQGGHENECPAHYAHFTHLFLLRLCPIPITCTFRQKASFLLLVQKYSRFPVPQCQYLVMKIANNPEYVFSCSQHSFGRNPCLILL